MQQLFEISERLLDSVSSGYKRSLYSNIDWDLHLIEIRGARGVGKTTLMLQKANEFGSTGKNVLYVTADLPYFYKNTLFETAETFYKYGGQYLFIDEIHKYPKKHKQADWTQEVKNIYDSIPDLKIVYSGSSILQLYKGHGDLSRRKVSYLLNGLSLREYLAMSENLNFEIFTLDEIVIKHQEIAAGINKQIKILPKFRDYLRHGYYPFYNESHKYYFDRISEIINVVIDTDIPLVSEIAYESLHKLKQLLAAVSTTIPYAPNLSDISSELYITDQRTLLKYLNLLEKAELITTLGAKAIGNKILHKPSKIYLNNTNLMHSIDPENIQIGTIRETFFYNQLNHLHKVNYPKQGDFMVDNQLIFEIGGKNKNKKQIKQIENSFLVLDDIETGFANSIPLWLFGFLY